MMKILFTGSLFVSALALTPAQAETYCAGATCDDAAVSATTSTSPPSGMFFLPPRVIYGFYLQFMLDDYGQKNPDLVVSPDVFTSDVTLHLELYETVNLLLFLDPVSLNLGLERSDFVPAGTELPTHPGYWDPSLEDPKPPLQFTYLTPEDYKGYLRNMLDDLLVRFPERTIPPEALPSTETVQVKLTAIANLLIFLDEQLDDRGWSPEVFEP